MVMGGGEKLSRLRIPAVVRGKDCLEMKATDEWTQRRLYHSQGKQLKGL